MTDVDFVRAMPKCELHLHIEGTLDSDERGNPPAKFAAVFARARAEGYLLTMHCDVDQENSIEHIRQCVEDIGVDRIGRLLDEGLRVTINSDDPAYFNAYVLENLPTVQEELNLDRAQLITLQRNAIEASWAPSAVRQRFLDQLAAL